MKQKSGETITCESCGASVYPEHLDSGIARYENGKLLCSHCVKDYEREHGAGDTGKVETFEPIQLESDEMNSSDSVGSGTTEMSSSRIHGMSEATLGHHAEADDAGRFKRPLDPKSPFATRCRTFHCKLSEGAIEFLNMQINEWLDNQTDIVVKFARSDIGMFEGKHKEPNLILTLFF
ncbi:MAG: hypothetical protein IH989_05500 [Planctomycetes bacterium]|nr:hypothetical protein [Planctomycetota bacterium]